MARRSCGRWTPSALNSFAAFGVLGWKGKKNAHLCHRDLRRTRFRLAVSVSRPYAMASGKMHKQFHALCFTALPLRSNRKIVVNRYNSIWLSFVTKERSQNNY
jgi:hypothetical protein